MTDTSPTPRYCRAEGKLTAWQWRAIADARQVAGSDIPVAVLKDGQDMFALLAMEDLARLMEALHEREAAT